MALHMFNLFVERQDGSRYALHAKTLYSSLRGGAVAGEDGLYAEHVIGDVRGFPAYNEVAHFSCPLARFASLEEKSGGLASLQNSSREVKRALVEAFDLVVSFLERYTGIKFSSVLLGSMLDDFMSCKVECAAVNVYNLPYAFLYMAGRKDIFGCGIDESIAKAIAFNCKGFRVNASRDGPQIGRKQGARGDLRLNFYGHGDSLKNGSAECIIMTIEELCADKGVELVNEVYSKSIAVDNAAFYNSYMERMRHIVLARSKLNDHL